MALVPVLPENIETFSVITNPHRHYVSSSSGLSEGSVYVYARRSHIEKEVAPVSSFIESLHNDADLSTLVKTTQEVMLASSSIISGYDIVDNYMSAVNDQAQSAKKYKRLDVVRLTPSYQFTKNTLKKLVIKDLLCSRYRSTYPTAHWAYSNYHSLNFFTSSYVNESSVLLYPNTDIAPYQHEGYISGTYTLSGAFSFDFYVNPRYTTPEIDGGFKAGTILHLSSSYAVSLVSGSLKDENGRPKGFRVQLQLSHSADIKPSLATPGSYPNDLVFLSDDNSLTRNCWHHVVIRWGTSLINGGSGSFNIDGSDKGTFVVPSGTVSPRAFTSKGNPDVLCVGNFYEGNNTGANAQALFFAADPALREGLEELVTQTSVNEPGSYAFQHPLNAELHDISIRRKYLFNRDIIASASKGPATIDDSYMFYLPPYFTVESPIRTEVNGYGGVLQTPFFSVNGSTEDPFNIALSFGVAGLYINTENFLREFANDVYPRQFHMTASMYTETTDLMSANEFLYAREDVRKRNLLIMPCDDGNFTPNYSVLTLEDTRTKYVDGLGMERIGYINLDNMVDTGSVLFGSSFYSEDKDVASEFKFHDDIIGSTPERITSTVGSAYQNFKSLSNLNVNDDVYENGYQSGAPLTIFQRTLDPSSNEVCVFDISNLYYGKRIKPGSFIMTDSSFSGSFGRMSITLKDDSNGNIYRANSDTPHATWNSVGNIFYDEGLVLIKSPHISLFGKHGFDMEFDGVQSVHVMKIDAFARANQVFSSSNPSFVSTKPSEYSNDPDSEFVVLTGVYFHDDNLNVIAKTKLAQPIVKRRGDKFVIRTKIDV